MTNNQREESHSYHRSTARQHPKITPPTHRSCPPGHYVTAAGVCRQIPDIPID